MAVGTTHVAFINFSPDGREREGAPDGVPDIEPLVGGALVVELKDDRIAFSAIDAGCLGEVMSLISPHEFSRLFCVPLGSLNIDRFILEIMLASVCPLFDFVFIGHDSIFAYRAAGSSADLAPATKCTATVTLVQFPLVSESPGIDGLPAHLIEFTAETCWAAYPMRSFTSARRVAQVAPELSKGECGGRSPSCPAWPAANTRLTPATLFFDARLPVVGLGDGWRGRV